MTHNMHTPAPPRTPVGLGLSTTMAPAAIPSLAAMAEDGGFGELWVSEDYFFTGGISAAAAVLNATTAVPVGVGVVSVMARHPAVLAMETATLAALHPGRLHMGIGLGAVEWLRQMGLSPASPLGALREGMTALRSLLDGQTVSTAGRYFTLSDIALDQPPSTVPPLYMGATGPKMLALSGEIADGTVASVLAGPRYMTWMREHIAAGQLRAGSSDPHEIVALALYSVDNDAAAARKTVREEVAFYLSIFARGPVTDASGISEELADMQERGGAEAATLIEREMPDAWLDELAIAGDPEQCADGIQRLLAAGADRVILCPVGDTEANLQLTAGSVLPEFAPGRTV